MDALSLKQIRTDSRFAASAAWWDTFLKAEGAHWELLKPVPGEELARIRREVAVPDALTRQLLKVSKGKPIALYTLLLAGFECFHARTGKPKGVWVASPLFIEGRELGEDAAETGTLLNRELALLPEIDPAHSFRTVLKATRTLVNQVRQHQVFPVRSVWEDLHSDAFPACLLSLEPLHPPGLRPEGFPFELNFVLEGEDLSLFWINNPKQIKGEWNALWIRGMLDFLMQLLAAPDTALGELALPGPASFRMPEEKPLWAASLAAGLEEVVADRESHSALLWEERTVTRTLSYGRFNEIVNALANEIRGLMGSRPEGRIGLMLERGPEMPLSIWAVLKAGFSYVPIDPAYPDTRKQFLFGVTDLILSTQALWEQHGEGDQLHLLLPARKTLLDWKADNPVSASGPDSIAYLIFTSGSTGKPKGVMIDHRALLNLCANTRPVLHLPGQRVLQVTNFVFDASGYGLLLALLKGACLCLPDQETYHNPMVMGQFIQRHQIATGLFPTTFIHQFVRYVPEVFQVLKQVCFGGEAAYGSEIVRARELMPAGTSLWNMYGPTEATILMTAYEVPVEVPELVASGKLNWGKGDVPIGKATDGMAVFIVDEQDRLLPDGLTGELLIAGAGLAKGYFDAPDLTAAAFPVLSFANPVGGTSVSIRVYRTGDLARRDANGDLVFMGRKDRQVKIRGHRVEPGEVEQQLHLLAGIFACAVKVVEQGGELALAAYCVLEPGVEIGEVRAQLNSRLPVYLQPQFWTVLDAMPLNASGKVDLKALPEPDVALEEEIAFEAPETAAEQLLAGIWGTVLGREQIGREDNFFRLGGDSIKMIQVSARLHQQGFQLAIRDFFDSPTLRPLAEKMVGIESAQHEQAGGWEGTFQPGPVQQWFLELKLPQADHFNQSLLLYFPDRLAGGHVRQLLDALVRHYASLRMVFRDGPEGWKGEVLPFNPDAPGYLFVEEAVPELWSGGLEAIPDVVATRIREGCEALQARLSLQEGPLLASGLFHTSGGTHLFLCIHHIAVDGVSWRILLEAIESGLQQLSGLQQVSGLEEGSGLEQVSGLQQSSRLEQTSGLPQVSGIQQESGLEQESGLPQVSGIQQENVGDEIELILELVSYPGWVRALSAFSREPAFNKVRVFWERFAGQQFPPFPFGGSFGEVSGSGGTAGEGFDAGESFGGGAGSEGISGQGFDAGESSGEGSGSEGISGQGFDAEESSGGGAGSEGISGQGADAGESSGTWSASVGSLGQSSSSGGCLVHEKQEYDIALPEADTRALLGPAHAAYGTEMNDLLLAALLYAWRISGFPGPLFLNLEGHGRDALPDGPDPSGTVGWFTSNFPVLLGPEAGAWEEVTGVADLVRPVKESLRAIPLKGNGFGIWQYLSPSVVETDGGVHKGRDAFQDTIRNAVPRPPVSFNYLGQFDADFSGTLFSASPIPVGGNIGPKNPVLYPLDINGLVSGGKLRFSFGYDPGALTAAKVELLAHTFSRSLEELADHCLRMKAPVLSPADLGRVPFSLSRFDALLERLPSEPEAILPLSPMQEGLLFHSIREPESAAYLEQAIFHIQGMPDPDAIGAAWKGLLNRYPVLRTVFDYQASNRPVQIVLKEMDADFAWADLSKEAEPELAFKDKLEAARVSGFRLRSGGLMRLRLFQISQDKWRLVWLYHHILFDGWCLSLLTRDFMALYSAATVPEPVREPVQLKPVEPFSRYLDWVEAQDVGAARDWWEGQLKGFRPQSLGKPSGQGHTSRYKKLVLDEGLSDALRQLASRHQLTVNSLFQACWLALLNRMTGSGDLCFGAVVSGRPAGLEGIEEMVGLFINTLPVRMQVDEGEDLISLAGRMQAFMLNAQQYGYFPLADIQALQGNEGPLFDHLLIFENYPVAEAVTQEVGFGVGDGVGSGGGGDSRAEAGAGSWSVSGVDILEATHYPLDLTIGLGTSIEILFRCQAEVFPTAFVDGVALGLERLFKVVSSDGRSIIEDLDRLSEINAQRELWQRLCDNAASLGAVPVSVDEIPYEEPATSFEVELAAYWKTLMPELETIGRYSHFFRSGGHSLKAVQITVWAWERFQVDLSVDEVFRHPVLEGLAGLIQERVEAVRQNGGNETSGDGQTLIGDAVKGFSPGDAVSDSPEEDAATDSRIGDADRSAGEARASKGGTEAFPKGWLPQSFEPARILPQPVQEWYPASLAQQRTWLVCQLEGANVAYNLSGKVELAAGTTSEEVRSLFQQLVDQQAILRTSFEIRDGRLWQRVAPALSFEVQEIKVTQADLNSVDSVDPFPTGSTALIRPFDLSALPLFRIFLVVLPSGKRFLFYDFHHLICDGFSLRLIGGLFDVLQNGQALAGIPFQYGDYALWQQAMLARLSFEAHAAFWLGMHQGRPSVLALPTDFARPPQQDFSGGLFRVQASPDLLVAVRRSASRLGGTPFMLLFACFKVLLSRYAGQEDLVVGVPAAGRNRAGLDRLIGMFVNTLAIRSQPMRGTSFEAYFHSIRDSLGLALKFQDFPFERLIELLDLDRDLSRHPLFDVMFSLEQGSGSEARVEEESFVLEGLASKYDLSLEIRIEGDSWMLNWQYASALFRQETIERLNAGFLCLLRAVLAEPDRKIGGLPVVDDAGLALLNRFSGKPAPGPGESLAVRFQEAVRLYGTHTALITDTGPLTFTELNERSSRLATLILDKLSGQPAPVLLYLSRNEWLMVSLWALLKAGCPYVPADPELPFSRVQYMAADSGAAAILFQENGPFPDSREGMPSIQLPLSDAFIRSGNASAPPGPAATDLAYITYTSGSTGQPKGVMLSHGNVAAFSDQLQPAFCFRPGQKILGVTAITFDIAVLELICSLLNGLTVVLANDEESRDPDAIRALIDRHEIELLQLTPSRLRLLWQQVGGSVFEGLDTLLVGGEAFPEDLHALWFQEGFQASLYNVYGPTETCIWSSFALLDASGVHIGQPFSGEAIYVLDPEGQQVPIGSTGELCIAGAGVAQGYCKREALTAERFQWVSLPGEDEPVRMYRTGDLGFWQSDGALRVVGRLDHQVKVRGYRIELGEIEHAMRQLEDVDDAVVKVTGSGTGKRIVAWVTGCSHASGLQLRSQLAMSLPAYMLPERYFFLDVFPLNSSGKVDRNQLVEQEGRPGRIAGLAPEDELESTIVGLFQSVLELEVVGVTDNFFELGGHSLQLVRVLSMAFEQLGGEIPFQAGFSFPTPRALAAYVRDLESAGMTSPDRPYSLLGDPAGKPVLLFPPALAYGIAYQQLAAALPGYAFYAFNFLEAPDRLSDYVNWIRELADPPYFLMSYSAGGSLTFEVAKALEAAGLAVSDLILLDAVRRVHPRAPLTEAEKDQAVRHLYAEDSDVLTHPYLRQQVRRKVRNYLDFYVGQVNSGIVKARIHLLYSTSGKDPDLDAGADFSFWKSATDSELIEYQGFGTHAGMLTQPWLEQNASRILHILNDRYSSRS